MKEKIKKYLGEVMIIIGAGLFVYNIFKDWVLNDKAEEVSLVVSNSFISNQFLRLAGSI